MRVRDIRDISFRKEHFVLRQHGEPTLKSPALRGKKSEDNTIDVMVLFTKYHGINAYKTGLYLFIELHSTATRKDIGHCAVQRDNLTSEAWTLTENTERSIRQYKAPNKNIRVGRDVVQVVVEIPVPVLCTLLNLSKWNRFFTHNTELKRKQLFPCSCIRVIVLS